MAYRQYSSQRGPWISRELDSEAQTRGNDQPGVHSEKTTSIRKARVWHEFNHVAVWMHVDAARQLSLRKV